MPGIFISYRRDDAAGYAGRLYDALAEHFGRDRVFIDIDTLQPGLDFVAALDQAVGTCDVLIALIGPRWLSVTDAEGRPRLENPEDFVHMEVATALRRSDIRVVPVLVGGGAMPAAGALPEPLKPLARRQAFELSDGRWDYDVRTLVSRLEPAVGPRRGVPAGLTRLRRRNVVLVAAGLVGGGGAAGLIAWLTDGEPGPPATREAAQVTPVPTPSAMPDPTRAPTAAPAETAPPPATAAPTAAPTATLATPSGVRFGNVRHPDYFDRLIADEATYAWENLGPRSVKGVVYHREGLIWETDEWMRDPAGGGKMGLLDYGVDDLSGEILRWNDPLGNAYPDLGVSSNRSPWANGPVIDPYANGLAFVEDEGVDAVNRDQVSIMIAGQGEDTISDACKDSVAALCAYFADQFEIPWHDYPTVPGKDYGFVRLHHEFMRGTGKTCPGRVLTDVVDEIVSRTRDILRRSQTAV